MPDQSQEEDSGIPEHLREYRNFLVAAAQKSQEDFDKTVLSLSGGALGISFVFLKDVIGPSVIVSPGFLFAAWSCWGASTLAVLLSFFMSHQAIRLAIIQVDEGTIYKQTAGGSFASLTAGLNAAGALLFVVGVFSMTFFVHTNLSSKGELNGNIKATATAAAASSPGKAGSRAVPR